MNRFYYFKKTFLSLAAGLFAGQLVYYSFDLDFSNTEAIKLLVLKSLFVAITTALILGLLNMFFQLGLPINKEKK